MAGECLIIGSTGFLGSQLAVSLSNAGISFDCLDRSPSQHPNITSSQAFHLPDLESLSNHYSAVFLTAAMIPDDKDRFSPELVEANIDLPRRVASQFPNSVLTFASSASVYGIPAENPIVESSPHNKLSAYGYSKLAGETSLMHHSNCRILRFSSLYGEGMRPDTFLPSIVADANQLNSINLLGNGSRQQNYLHVKDASNMMLSAAQNDCTGVFNAVSDRSHSNLEVARIICELLPETKIEFSGKDDSPSFLYDNSKWSSHIPYQPSISLASGLSAYIQNAHQSD
ncbi:MAG: NAD-dependent epimerase/dehydratase family protein [Verrucomicrobiales bacterium]